jgi:hypothetical protein
MTGLHQQWISNGQHHLSYPHNRTVSHRTRLAITILHNDLILRRLILPPLPDIPVTEISQPMATMVLRHILRNSNRYRHHQCMIP